MTRSNGALGFDVVIVGCLLILAFGCGGDEEPDKNVPPGAEVEEKSVTYDLYLESDLSLKVGRVTFLVRKVMGVEHEGAFYDYYEIDKDVRLEIMNSRFKTRPPNDGNEVIPNVYSQSFTFTADETFAIPIMGRIKNGQGYQASAATSNSDFTYGDWVA